MSLGALVMILMGGLLLTLGFTLNNLTLRLDLDRRQVLLERCFIHKSEHDTFSFDSIETFVVGDDDLDGQFLVSMHIKDGRAIGIGTFYGDDARKAADACRAAVGVR